MPAPWSSTLQQLRVLHAMAVVSAEADDDTGVDGAELSELPLASTSC
jgi:hypothetical protein